MYLSLFNRDLPVDSIKVMDDSLEKEESLCSWCFILNEAGKEGALYPLIVLSGT